MRRSRFDCIYQGSAVDLFSAFRTVDSDKGVALAGQIFHGWKATWKREFRLPWREAGPSNHFDDEVDSDQKVVNKELSSFHSN